MRGPLKSVIARFYCTQPNLGSSRFKNVSQDYIALESQLLDQVLGRVRKTSEDMIREDNKDDFDFDG